MVTTLAVLFYITFAAGTLHGLFDTGLCKTTKEKVIVSVLTVLWPLTYTYRFAYNKAQD